MNQGEDLPREDHIARFCKGSQIEDGVVDGAAFELKLDKGETEISVNWLDFFDYSDHETAIKELQKVFASKMENIRRTHKFAKLNIAEVIKHVQAEAAGETLRIIYAPEQEHDDWSHSLICGMVENHQIISVLIAQKVLEIYPAKAE